MTPRHRTDSPPNARLPPALRGLALVALAALPLSGLAGITEALLLAVGLTGWALAAVLKRNAALARESRTLRLAIDTSEDAMAILNGRRAIDHENEAFRRAFATQREAHQHFSRFLIDTFSSKELAPLIAAIETASAWRGRVTARRASQDLEAPSDFELLVTPVALPDTAETSVLVTLRDVTQLVADERLQRLAVEGEKAKTDIAIAMALDESLTDRCSASLASVCLMEGMETLCKGAIYLRPAPGAALELTSYCGDFSEHFLRQPLGRGTEALVQGELLTIDSCAETGPVSQCDTAAPHGHYLVPLMERPGEVLGALLLYTSERPIRDAPRLEALTAIAEVFATAVLRDRTARLLQESSRKAEEATRAKSDFLATMSHEIRTPMNGVLGFTQLLLESQLSAEQRENAQLIYNSAEALLSLLNDILDFSKIEAGKLVIDPRPTAIVEAAREAIGLLRATATKKGIELRFSAGAEIPRGLMVDPMRFRQVLLNLTGNAVKFTPSGAVDITLDLERDGEGEGRWLSVKVKDSGIGISPTVLPNLFGKFVQADTSTSRRFGGSGLGLAISKRLVELMGGTIGATSVESVGSTFFFRIPLVEAVVEGGRASVSRPTPTMHHRRVLLAEDNPINQILARKVLEKLSAEVVIAPNGVMAVQHALAGGFDLVLMDCQMPEMDGYDATRAIRRWEADTGRRPLPIIAVTANAFAEDAQKCRDSGMDAVLTKPFKVGDLERTLRDLDDGGAAQATG
jgi:signal transduction histidine kinase